jgi:lactate dehydrogenase-like 2-hydroxyacid dehydrogenase
MSAAGVTVATKPSVNGPSVNGVGLGDGLADAIAGKFRLNRAPAPLDASSPVLVALGTRVDDALLDQFPKLGLLAVMGAGFDHVDTAALKRRGVALANTPGMTDNCVADLAFGLLIAAQRRIVTADQYLRAGKWPQARFPLAPRFSGRRLGIYGMGRIGVAIARRAQGFDLEVAYHNRHRRADHPARYFDDLAALASWSDYLVVACPATPETRHKVDRLVLKALGPQGVLVNIARGAVIDEPAMIEALADGTIASAGLDVFEHEPQVPARLLQMGNVVLTPHIAGGSVETWNDCYAGVVANIDSFFRTGRAVTPVDLTGAA